MSPKKQENSLPSLRVTDELRIQTEKCADIKDEKLSEYIRKSVEERNKRVLGKKPKEQIEEIQVGDYFVNQCTGEEYVAVQVRKEEGVVIGENKKEKRAFAKDMTYTLKDLRKKVRGYGAF